VLKRDWQHIAWIVVAVASALLAAWYGYSGHRTSAMGMLIGPVVIAIAQVFRLRRARISN